MFLSNKKFFEPESESGSGIINPFADAKPGDLVVTQSDDNGDFPEHEEPKEEAEKVEELKPEEKPVEVPKEVVEEKIEEKVEEKPQEQKPEEPKEEPKIEKPQVNWKDELKKADKWEVLKELGLDEFEIDLLKYKEATGDLTPYLEAKTVDYSKMTDEQIMRHDLSKQYKSLSDEELELLYESKVNEQYKLDAEVHGDAAAKLGRALLKVEADKIRQREIDEQKKFKAPEKPVDDTAQRQQQEQEAKYAEYKEYVNDNKETKALLKDKRLVYGSGESAFNYNVEKPESLVETALNPNLLFSDLVDKNGNADLVKVYKAKAYIANMDKVEQLLIEHGKTLGEKKSFEGLQNPSVKQAAPVVPDTDMTPAQALAKMGRVSGG